jgi:hypothetical protein
MNLDHVCVENPRFVPSPPSSHGELKRKAACDNDCRGQAERSASEAALKQILIEIALEKIAAHGLFGREHVLQYLMDLYRRNCRPNTLRSRFASIFVFLQYLKAQGRQLLEQVSREDVCAFIEQEQDRGLGPASVCCRLEGLYAFIGYFRYHALRHFGASLLEQSNVPIGSIQRILGHENRLTTEIYLHSIGDSERFAMQVLNEGFGEVSHTDSHTDKKEATDRNL